MELTRGRAGNVETFVGKGVGEHPQPAWQPEGEPPDATRTKPCALHP